MQKRANTVATLVFIFFVSVSCARVTLYNHQPKSPDEEAIIEVTKVNQDTLKNKDLSGHLATFHDNASIMIWRGKEVIVSNEEYAEWLPNTTRWGAPGVLYDIKITVSGDKADFKGRHETYMGYNAPVTSVLVKENDKWYILDSRFGKYR
jgi:hypothetical protein